MTYRWLLVAAILVPGGAYAQWLNYSPSGTPMKDGKPDFPLRHRVAPTASRI